jgi:hypothetical protein
MHTDMLPLLLPNLLLLSPQELLTMPKRDANLRAEVLLRRWKFPNTYTMVRPVATIMTDPAACTQCIQPMSCLITASMKAAGNATAFHQLCALRSVSSVFAGMC